MRQHGSVGLWQWIVPVLIWVSCVAITVQTTHLYMVVTHPTEIKAGQYLLPILWLTIVGWLTGGVPALLSALMLQRKPNCATALLVTTVGYGGAVFLASLMAEIVLLHRLLSFSLLGMYARAILVSVRYLNAVLDSSQGLRFGFVILLPLIALLGLVYARSTEGGSGRQTKMR